MGQKTMAASTPVAIASDQGAVPVSVAALPLPAGAATEATLGAMNAKVPTVGQKTMAASTPVAIASDQGALPVSAAALPLPAGAATETTLAALSGKVPTVGQKAMAASTPVAIASDQGTLPVSAAILPLPAGAATEVTTAALNTKTPALGVAVSAASRPVVLASDQAAIPVGTRDLVASSYNVAGVIAINTDLMTIDCLALRGVSVQCVAIGVAGVVTTSWSNDNVNFIAATLMTPAGLTAATITAAGLWVLPVAARYLRLRLTTATTSGATTFAVAGSALPIGQPVSQPIAGAVSVSSGSVTASVTGGTMNPVAPATPFFLNSAATTNGALIVTGTCNLSTIYATNIGATAAFIKLYNKATAPVVGTDIPEMIIPVPAAVSGVPGVATPPIGFHGQRFALGLGIEITGGVADADVVAVAAGQVKVKLSRTT